MPVDGCDAAIKRATTHDYEDTDCCRKDSCGNRDANIWLWHIGI